MTETDKTTFDQQHQLRPLDRELPLVATREVYTMYPQAINRTSLLVLRWGEATGWVAQMRDSVERIDDEADVNFPQHLISRLEVRSAYY